MFESIGHNLGYYLVNHIAQSYGSKPIRSLSQVLFRDQGDEGGIECLQNSSIPFGIFYYIQNIMFDYTSTGFEEILIETIKSGALPF